MTKEALTLALESLENYDGQTWEQTKEAITAIKEALAQEKALQALHDENERLGLYKDAYAEPEEEKLHPVHIGVDVTREGTAVTAFYRKSDAVMEMFYSQFHPLAQPEKTVCPFCSSEWVTAEQHDRKMDRLEQEPVALETVYETIIQWDEGGGKRSRRELARRIVSLYTTPPQRKPLTDEQRKEIAFRWRDGNGTASEIIDMVEAAHGIKEKNT